MKIQIWIGILLSCLLFNCATSKDVATLTTQNLTQLKPVIQERGKIWGKALRTKNVELLKDLYDQNAHYLPNNDKAKHGKANIIAYWQQSLAFLGDLQLNMETLEGTANLLYETGNGTVKVMGEDGNFFDMPFKYVNLWKKQPDGRYKVVVDTFNSLGNE